MPMPSDSMQSEFRFFCVRRANGDGLDCRRGERFPFEVFPPSPSPLFREQFEGLLGFVALLRRPRRASKIISVALSVDKMIKINVLFWNIYTLH
jgi:hypothetical protein